MLIKQWLKLHKTKASALRALNQALGARYTSNRLYDWIHDKHRLPIKVEKYMRREAIEYIAESEGLVLGSRALTRLARKLS